jgi:hypothetical protein
MDMLRDPGPRHGTFQSSLRDFSIADTNPGLRPGLSSAVPAGLNPELVAHPQISKMYLRD